MLRAFLITLIVGTSLSSGGSCPAFPEEASIRQSASLALESKAHSFSLRPHEARTISAPSANLIDDFIFSKMAADGVQAAPPATDSEVLRRLSLDLTGRIPTGDQVVSFLNDTDSNKRVNLIDSLLSSDAFVDYWTFFFGDKFQVTSRYYNLIGVTGRSLFYNLLRDFVVRDRSYRDFATELITASGDSTQNAALNFSARSYQFTDPIQDTWDDLGDRITTLFLGVQTQCVSCHDGAHHLEPINLYLSVHKREDFWRQSAFLSRTNWTQVTLDAPLFQSKLIINDRPTGAYTGIVDPGNPGVRPARSLGPYSARSFFSGETPKSDQWRAEFASMVTSDRQFARAAVNYIWAHFFRNGIVDPPDNWDLSRINPQNPPAAPWTLQPSHPDLLEALADEFINSNYSIRHIIELIAKSNAYQLSSHYPSEWKPEYERYFARHLPRRLEAEEIYDAITTATDTKRAMQVEGMDHPVYYATQLPDASEPQYDDVVLKILQNFGRGDWLLRPRKDKSGVVQVLFMMNNPDINGRSFADRYYPTRVSQVMLSAHSDDEAIQQLFLSTLSRYPTDEEAGVLRAAKGGNYAQWLSDVQWALLNKVEFIFNN